MATTERETWKPGDPIGYITPDTHKVDLPPYKGERYEADVPDTLELQERARLAIHCMTETTDPEADYEPYYMVHFRDNPPMMIHNSWHGSTLAKYMETVALMRIMSGSDQNSEVERRWMEVTLHMQGPDGLIYTPTKGRPWAHRDVGFETNVEDYGYGFQGDQYITAFGNGRMLSTMSLFAQRDGGPVWRDAARRLVDGLAELAVDDGDIAYFYPNILVTKKGPPPDGWKPTSFMHSETSRVPFGLVHAYRLLGYEPAATLAGKILTFLRRHSYGEDGTFFSTPDNPRMAHFHSHAHGLLVMQQYAETMGDDDMMAFAVRSFEWAKSVGSNVEMHGWDTWENTPGADLVGYFPEHVDSPRWEGSEICEVADMVALALKLSEAGVGDYWDDADRWARNMLAEGQLLSTDWIYRLPESGMTNHDPVYLSPSVAGPYNSTDRVPERNLGAFAGYPAANDWYVGDGPGTMHCCTVNGARAMYWVWDHALRHQDDTLRLNLLLNRASQWADVDSYIPYLGRIDVKVKQPVRLEIRIPEWVAPSQTRCTVNTAERRLDWNGRYAKVGDVKPGDTVTLTFPIEERTDIVHIEKQRFTLVRKGNEVVAIDPPGRHNPLYQRQHYRQSNPRWHKIERFVSKEQIDW